MAFRRSAPTTIAKVRGANEEPGRERGRSRRGEGDEDEEGAPKLSPSKALKTYAVNLAERAAKGKIDPLIGRKNEIERAIHMLLRRRKNNPVFVGEAGVGKTALAEGLALAIHDGKVPERAQGRAKSTRSTWARCSPAPAFAATSSSA